MKNIEIQVKELIGYYPNLQIIKEDNESFLLNGEIFINAQNNNIQLADYFDIEIEILKKFPDRLPRIKENSNKISKKFEHVNHDGTLCLAINTEMMLYIKNNPNLSAWFNKYVVDFFYTVIYFNKYGVAPFGERAHGIKGIVQFYKEYFEERNIIRVYKLLEMVVHNKIKGHYLCVCGSGKKCRCCHFEKLIKLYGIEEVKKDFLLIAEVIKILNKRKKKDFVIYPYTNEKIKEILKIDKRNC